MQPEALFAMFCGASPIETSGDKAARRKLNRGGSCQANRTLHSIVVSRMRNDARTSEYTVTHVFEGKSKREATPMQCLKRYVVRKARSALMSPMATRHAAGSSYAARRKRVRLLQRNIAARLETGPSLISSIEPRDRRVRRRGTPVKPSSMKSRKKVA